MSSGFIFKVAISALLIVTISSLAKRMPFLASLVASLPITTIVAMFWMKFDHQTDEEIGIFAAEVGWLVIPSLLFFFCLPIFLKRYNFQIAIGLASAITVSGYGLVVVLRRFFVT